MQIANFKVKTHYKKVIKFDKMQQILSHTKQSQITHQGYQGRRLCVPC